MCVAIGLLSLTVGGGTGQRGRALYGRIGRRLYVTFIYNLILQTLTFVAGVCARELVALDVTPIPN
jgi:hypothetical protein